MPTRIVRYDECLISIAAECGVSPEALLNEPKNQELLQARHRSGCLAPGDEIALPEQSRGQALTINDHTVLKVREPWFRLAVTLLKENYEPLGGQEVRFVWPDGPGALIGKTDAKGVVRFQLPLSCHAGLLAYEYQGAVTYQPMTIGTLQPYEEAVGKIQRLCALNGQAVTTRAASVSAEEGEAMVHAFAQEAGQEQDSFEDRLKGKTNL